MVRNPAVDSLAESAEAGRIRLTTDSSTDDVVTSVWDEAAPTKPIAVTPVPVEAEGDEVEEDAVEDVLGDKGMDVGEEVAVVPVASSRASRASSTEMLLSESVLMFSLHTSSSLSESDEELYI